jgi:hypothetical protein
MKTRKIKSVDISSGLPVYRFKRDWLDRFRAEGIKHVSVYINDETGEIRILPGDEVPGKEKEESGE